MFIELIADVVNNVYYVLNYVLRSENPGIQRNQIIVHFGHIQDKSFSVYTLLVRTGFV